MKNQSKLKPTQPMIISLVVLLIILLIISLVQCSPSKDQLTHPDEDEISEVITLEDDEPREYHDRAIPESACSFGTTLKISDGPGKPKELQETGFAVDETPTLNLLDTAIPDLIIKPIVLKFPHLQFDVNPNQNIKVTSPKKDVLLVGGNTQTILWEIDSGRELLIDISITHDNGKNYEELASQIPNSGTYEIVLPKLTSSGSKIRVDAWIGEVHFGYNLSPTFKIELAKEPDKPDPNLAPNPNIKLLNPNQNEILQGGLKHIILWQLDFKGDLKIDISITHDNEKTYSTLASKVTNTGFHQVTIPKITSKASKIRIDAYSGNTHLGYNISPLFQIIIPEKPVVEVDVPSKYTEGLTFVREDKPVRYLAIEHDLKDVAQIIWQVSRIEFPCSGYDFDYSKIKVPGLMAQGKLDPSQLEFKLDFRAIVSAINTLGPPPENEGENFEVEPDILPIQGLQKPLFVRVVMLDENENIMGASLSNLEVIYGNPLLSINTPIPEGIIPGEPVYTDTNHKYVNLGTKGLWLYSGYQFESKMSVNPLEAKVSHVEMQIATEPFNKDYMVDYLKPSGLVYSDTFDNHPQYGRSSLVKFHEIFPKFNSVNPQTRTYYIRFIKYIRTEHPEVFIPLASNMRKIYYTDDLKVYTIGLLDLPEPDPVEVILESYIPDVKLLSYRIPRFALKDEEQYFEVTRPIEAEEWHLFIKNHETGDFLYPFYVHMHMYPKTTREQYQATLDRMLPTYAWFKVQPKEKSKLGKMWDDFVSLASEILNKIVENYEKLKVTVAEFVADRFEFLGEKAQGYIKKAVVAVINYGLASMGIPPTLPNFERLAKEGLDYAVNLALQQAADSLNVPLDQIPYEVEKAIVKELKDQFDELSKERLINPWDVDFLKPATKAQYLPPEVMFEFHNPYDKYSKPGVLYISITEGIRGESFTEMYKLRIDIPALPPKRITHVKFFLKRGDLNKYMFDTYFNNPDRLLNLNISASFELNNVLKEAAAQGKLQTKLGQKTDYKYDKSDYYTISYPMHPSKYLDGRDGRIIDP